MSPKFDVEHTAQAAIPGNRGDAEARGQRKFRAGRPGPGAEHRVRAKGLHAQRSAGVNAGQTAPWSALPGVASPTRGAGSEIGDRRRSVCRQFAPRPRQIAQNPTLERSIMRETTNVALPIVRLHPELDDRQRELIGHLEGPLLGIAGPGAGKTLAIVLRAANLLLLGEVEPRALLLCTYSRAAAWELRRRFDTTVAGVGYRGDTSRARITTLHGLCGQLLRRYAPQVGLPSRFRLLNEVEQRDLLAQRFHEVFGPDLGRLEGRGWRRPEAVVRNASRYFDRICDELIDPRELIDSGRRFKAALGRCYRRYEDLLQDQGVADFAHLQRWTVELLEDGDGIAGEVSGDVRHLLCDEYQDTGYVQERLLRRLSQTHHNLCVVGDEDQSLYRFRGASVENILNFTGRFPDCRVVTLTVNYRSHPAIVGAYDQWMASADWSNPAPGGFFLPPRQDHHAPCAGG